MALSAFTTGQSLKNIVDDCERICATPKLNLSVLTNLEPTAGNLRDAPAYRWLLDILRSLYLLHDWPFATKATSIGLTTGGRSFNLPLDFWRIAMDGGCWITKTGVRERMVQQTRAEFFGSSFSQNNDGQPCYFYIERSSGSIFVEPRPDQPYFLEIHYFALLSESVGGGSSGILSVPTFPYHDYLLAALKVKYFEDQDDSRLAVAEMERQKLWAQIKGTTYDIREDTEQTIPLDPQWFPRPHWGD